MDNVRIDRTERSAALLDVGPPVPCKVRVTAVRRPEVPFYVPDLTDLTVAEHLIHKLPSRLEPKLEIDQRQYVFTFRSCKHLFRFARIHRHRLFTQYILPLFDREKRHFPMPVRRRGYANEIDVGVRDGLGPVVREMS